MLVHGNRMKNDGAMLCWILLIFSCSQDLNLIKKWDRAIESCKQKFSQIPHLLPGNISFICEMIDLWNEFNALYLLKRQWLILLYWYNAIYFFRRIWKKHRRQKNPFFILFAESFSSILLFIHWVRFLATVFRQMSATMIFLFAILPLKRISFSIGFH